MPSRFVLVTLSIITTQTALAQPVATPYLHGNFGDVEFRRGGPGLSVGYFGRRLGVELDLDRHHHFYKDDELESIPNPCVPSVPVGMCIDNDTEAWIVMGNVLAFLPVSSARWRPYGTAGTGLIHAWIHGAGPYNSEQNNLGVNLGAGTTFRLNDWLGLRADVRYFHVFVDEDEPDGGYTEDYDFVRVSLGLTFAIPSL